MFLCVTTHLLIVSRVGGCKCCMCSLLPLLNFPDPTQVFSPLISEMHLAWEMSLSRWWSIVQPRRRDGAAPEPPQRASGCLRSNVDSICNQKKKRKADDTPHHSFKNPRPCCATGRQKGGPCSVRADADVCSLLCPPAERHGKCLSAPLSKGHQVACALSAPSLLLSH